MTPKLPYPYQVEGARFLASGRRRFLADDMGLGKTAQAILACDLVGADNILIVCPGIVRSKWISEFDAFSPIGRSAHAILTGADPIPDGGIMAVSYDLLRNDRVRRLLYKRTPFDVVIADEAHYLKNRSARRTRLMYGQRGVVDRARYYWPLSATPTPNNYAEWWAHLRKMGYADKWPTFEQFQMHFCEGYTDDYNQFHVTGGRNVAELQAVLDRCVLRRLTGDVLKDLPPLRIGERYVELPKRLPPGLAPDDDMADMLEAALAEGPAAVADLVAPTERRLWGLAKVPGTIEAAKEWFADGGKKLVLYGHHPAVLDAIAKGLRAFNPVLVHGKTSGDGSEQCRRFNEDPDCRVFLGQIQSAGVGIDLVAASTIWLVEQDWTDDNNQQVIKRLHRIGQKEPVLAEFVTLPGTIDERIAQAYSRKARDNAKLYGQENVAKNETSCQNSSQSASGPISIHDL